MPWLQALDLFALPSYGEEGVPQAIMQAMACGIPVVSTPVGAITEAVDAERHRPRRPAARPPRRWPRASRDCATTRRCAGASAARRASAPWRASASTACWTGWRRCSGWSWSATTDMCGIAGYLRQPQCRPGDRRADAGGAAPARARRRARGVLGRRASAQRRAGAQRAAAHAAVDHRPAPAWPTSRWATTAGDVWIAYNGEVYDWAADARDARGRRLRVPHALRHRVHPARVRALGHRLPLAPARHVRHRDPRPAPAARCSSSATAWA